MADEFLRDRVPEAEIAAADSDPGRFPRKNRLAALEKVMREHPGVFTYLDGLAVRSGDKVYRADGKDVTPKPPHKNL